MIKGWTSHYSAKPIVSGSIDNYRIEFFFEKDLETTQKTTQKIILAMTENPKVTRKELAQITGITEDGVKFHLNRLKASGVIKRIGPDKGGHWEVFWYGR